MKIYCLLLLFLSSITYCQSTIAGKVVAQNFPINNADIINFEKRISTTTEEDGTFKITVTINDILIIYAKNFEVIKHRVSSEDIANKSITISLVAKAIELDEVIVEELYIPKLDNQTIMKIQYQPDAMTSPQNSLIYDGQSGNGGDILGLFSVVIDLFKSKKKKEVKYNWLKTYLLTYFEMEYLLNNFDIYEFEFDKFIKFCEKDSKTREIFATNDSFSLIDFLKIKSDEFKEN